MSDTPQTDQAEASALEVGQWHLAKLCRELERENAALLEYCQRLERDSELFRADIVPRLQEDKARLDWLLTYKGRDWLFRSIENGELIESITSDRELIDAARKEAQP